MNVLHVFACLVVIVFFAVNPRVVEGKLLHRRSAVMDAWHKKSLRSRVLQNTTTAMYSNGTSPSPAMPSVSSTASPADSPTVSPPTVMELTPSSAPATPTTGPLPASATTLSPMSYSTAIRAVASATQWSGVMYDPLEAARGAAPEPVDSKFINIGGVAFTDGDGNVWEADDDYINGVGFFGFADPVESVDNTELDILYQSERFDRTDPSSMEFNIALPGSNFYDINLHFAEFWFRADGSDGLRVFDVIVDGSVEVREFEDVDVYSLAGGADIAYIIAIDNFPVQDQLDIKFGKVTENPKLSAVSLTRVSPTEPTISPAPTPPPTSTPTFSPGSPYTKFINVGGGAPWTDPDGNVWEADDGYINGVGSFGFADPLLPVDNTELDILYHSERYDLTSPSSMEFTIPLPSGNYDIDLLFAEFWFRAPGSEGLRVFDVIVDGSMEVREFEDVDVYSLAGGADIAYVIAIDNFPVQDQLDIKFRKIIENPKLSAVSLSRVVVEEPTALPTEAPTVSPTTASPVFAPTDSPTVPPSDSPIVAPTDDPPVAAPTDSPVLVTPTESPVLPPTEAPIVPPTGPAFFKFINVGGGEPWTDPDGNVWEADDGYINGVGSFGFADPLLPVDNTELDILYQSERYDLTDPSRMEFTIPVPKVGFYNIDLHFAEFWFRAPDSEGLRVFDITVDGTIQTLQIQDVDVYRDAGGADIAYIITVPSFAVESELKISFVKQVENPKLSAIAIQEAFSGGSFALGSKQVSVDRTSAAEVLLNVVRLVDSSGESTVDFMTVAGTATPGEDYEEQQGTLTFDEGVTVQSIVIPVLNNGDTVGTEQFRVVIDNPQNAGLLAPRTAIVTLFDPSSGPFYLDFSSIAGLSLNGDAQQDGNRLRLTDDVPEVKAGSAFFQEEVSLADGASFRAQFSFSIQGGTAGRAGHGLTFAIQNESPTAVGNGGSAMGFSGIGAPTAIGIEFDTRSSIPGELGNNHVAIIRDSVANEIVQAPAGYVLHDGSTYYAWVDYNGNTNSLSAYLSTTPEKPQFLLVETTIDLNDILGQEAYFGFTAGTGVTWNNAHYIHSWIMDDLEPSPDPPVDPNLSLRQVDIVENIFFPMSVAWLPDETMLIAQKSGIVRVATGGFVLPVPFIDISDITNDVADRGLMDIAIHPDFENYPYVYLLFCYEGMEPPIIGEDLAGPDGRGNRAGRLVRVKADVNNDYLTAADGSDADDFVILLGNNSTRQYFNPWVDSTDDLGAPPAGIIDGENVRDFIASDSNSHTVGSLAFSPSGDALYVSVGDGTSYNAMDRRTWRVQDIDSLSGKLLRIDPLTGAGLRDNPFFTSDDPQSNRAKVFQLGLRNPFRISIDKLTEQVSFPLGNPEINTGPVGTNFGWPYYEGGNGESLENGAYADSPEGRAFERQNVEVTPAIYALNHGADGIDAVVLGEKLSSDYYGPEFQGNLFLNNLGGGIIRRLSFNEAGDITSIDVFATDTPYFVKIIEGPDGALYYCSLIGNRVGRWEFL